MNNKIDRLGEKAIKYWGESAQKQKAIEECAELIAAMARRSLIDFIVDEVADVTIMMRQLRMIYGKKKVDDRIRFKLKRLQKRLP